jgi:hypothetical protein
MAHRKHREAGGVNEPGEDLDIKSASRTVPGNVNREAEEKKHGGRAKRARGGKLHHVSGDGKLIHEVKGHSMRHQRKRGGRMEEKKHVDVHGEHEKHRADRKPRKDGGRTGADSHPFSSARHGVDPPGHKTEHDADYE